MTAMVPVVLPPTITLETWLDGDRTDTGFPPFVERLVAQIAERVLQRMFDRAPVGKRLFHPKSKREGKRGSLGTESIKRGLKVLQMVQPGSGVMAQALVGSEAEHARYVVKGTRPHIIENRRAKVLTIPVDGSAYTRAGFGEAKRRFQVDPSTGQPWYFAKRVRHPGTRPNPFMDDASQITEAEMEECVKLASRDVDGEA